MRVPPRRGAFARNLAPCPPLHEIMCDPPHHRETGVTNYGALPVRRRPFGYDQWHGDQRAPDRHPALDHAGSGREDPRADGRGAGRRHDGAARGDPGRRLLRFPVRPRVRHPGGGRRSRARARGRQRRRRSLQRPVPPGRHDRLPHAASRSPGSRSTTRTPPPRAAAATPSRWKRAPRATALATPTPAAAAPAARTELDRFRAFRRHSAVPAAL